LGEGITMGVATYIKNEKEEIEEVTLQSGIRVEAVYGPEDLVDLDYARDLGNPGEYPFTRGIHPGMYRTRPWTMRPPRRPTSGSNSSSPTARRV
jgi:methylmalonyl-CoA mutase N-terminal domain/subunit